MMIALVALLGIVTLGLLITFGVRCFATPQSEAQVMANRFGPGNPAKDERFMKRFRPRPSHSTAQLSWVNDGKKHSLKVQVIDLSDDGAGVKTNKPVPRDTSVILEIPNLQLAGTAKVCYCRETTWAYTIGLAFKGPLFRVP